MKYPIVHTQNIERAWCEMHIHIATEVLRNLKVAGHAITVTRFIHLMPILTLSSSKSVLGLNLFRPAH